MKITIKENLLKEERYSVLARAFEIALEKETGRQYEVTHTTEMRSCGGFPEIYINLDIKPIEVLRPYDPYA